MRGSLVAIGVAFAFAAVPVPAAAQSAETPKSQTPENIKTAADVAGVGTGVFKSAVDCGRIANDQQKLLAAATSYKELGKGFEHIGNVLTLVTATTQAAQGDTAGELQTAFEVALDKAVCKSLGAALCVGWNTGR